MTNEELLAEAYDLLSSRSSLPGDDGEDYSDDEVCAWLEKYRAAQNDRSPTASSVHEEKMAVAFEAFAAGAKVALENAADPCLVLPRDTPGVRKWLRDRAAAIEPTMFATFADLLRAEGARNAVAQLNTGAVTVLSEADYTRLVKDLDTPSSPPAALVDLMSKRSVLEAKPHIWTRSERGDLYVCKDCGYTGINFDGGTPNTSDPCNVGRVMTTIIGGPKRPEYEPRSPEQRLSYLVEECAEVFVPLSIAIGRVLAAAGKSLRWGYASSNPELPEDQRETNAAWLRRELADLKAAMARVDLDIKDFPSDPREVP